MKPYRYYVYALLAENDVVSYVGKGSGSRLQVQMKKFGLNGIKLKEFHSESKAYDYEREMIALHKPESNKCPGGNGSRAKRAPKRTKMEMEMEKVGTRTYAARFLLSRHGLENYISKENIAQLKVVAEGRC